jgi:transcriptional regulator with XRE-family HTH domain
MASVAPPRARLGELLRLARRAARVDQASAAQHAGISQGNMSKIENGARLPTVEVLQALATYYRMPDNDLERACGLREECVAHKRRPGVRLVSHTAPHFRRVAEFEGEATTIFGRFNVIVPGLLQTEAYAKTLFQLAGRTNIAEMAAARRRRQETLFDGPNPPLCLFILHEACLRTTMGQPEMAMEQLQHLLDLTERNITIAALPYAAPVSPTSFDIWVYRFPEGGRRPCAVVEHEGNTLVIDSPAELSAYEQRLHLAMLGALDPVDSRLFIQGVLDSLREQQSRTSHSSERFSP